MSDAVPSVSPKQGADSTPPPVHSAMGPAVSTQGMHPESVEDFRLPSCGVPYGGRIPGGRVQIRMMTGAEEAILNSKRLNEQAKVSRIIRACTIFPESSGGFDPIDLLMTDRLMLIIAIRVYSLGATYTMSAVDPATSIPFEVKVDLVNDINPDMMPRTHLDKDGNSVTYEYDAEQGIPVTLPTTGRKVTLRLLTGRDEKIISEELARGTDSRMLPPWVFSADKDPSFYLRNILSIREWGDVNGHLIPVNPSNPQAMASMCLEIERLPLRDLLYLDAVYARWDVDINMSVTTRTPSGQTITIPIQVDASFFRPADLF